MIELRVVHDKNEWDEYILEHKGHPLQLWGWGQVKMLHGWRVERVFAVTADDTVIGAAQILFRPLPSPLRSFAYVPRGPVGELQYRSDILELLADWVKTRHKSVALSIESDWLEFPDIQGWVRATNKILPAETILLDITKSESDLLADMAKKTRQYIRKSSADVVIKQARTQEELQACLALYKETAQRAGFNLHNDEYYLNVFAQMQDHSPVFMAMNGDEPVAFLWLAISVDAAYELYGGVNETGQALRANYALKWHAIRKSKEWGLSLYDFGGLVAGGVATFKQGWAADQTTFAGTFDKPLSPLYVIWSKGLPFVKKTLQKIRRK